MINCVRITTNVKEVGVKIFIIQRATESAEMRSLIAAKTSGELIPYSVESTEMTSLAISSPESVLLSSCNFTNRCCIVKFEGEIKRRMMARASPS